MNRRIYGLCIAWMYFGMVIGVVITTCLNIQATKEQTKRLEAKRWRASPAIDWRVE